MPIRLNPSLTSQRPGMMNAPLGGQRPGAMNSYIGLPAKPPQRWLKPGPNQPTQVVPFSDPPVSQPMRSVLSPQRAPAKAPAPAPAPTKPRPGVKPLHQFTPTERSKMGYTPQQWNPNALSSYSQPSIAQYGPVLRGLLYS